MAATLALKPIHPAMLVTGLSTPPLTPTSPICASPIAPSAPVASYAQLRAMHASSLKYVIAKLRWEQTNNGYLRGEDAWLNHNMMINKLDKELADCNAAQKTLDRFPNCYASTAFPKPHGPLTHAEFTAEKTKEAEELKAINARLDAQFPFIKQMFIGPRTKQQARDDKLLRELMKEGDFDDLSVLLPSENMRVLMGAQHGGQKKAAGGAAPAEKKKTYEQLRMEKEKAKVELMNAERVKAVGAAETAKKVSSASPAARIGPLTREEYLATLPVYGPKTLEETLLPTQREQRHVILSWLRKPWPVFDTEAAELMERLGRLAYKKLDVEVKEAKAAKDQEKTKEAKEIKDVKEAKPAEKGKENPAKV